MNKSSKQAKKGKQKGQFFSAKTVWIVFAIALVGGLWFFLFGGSDEQVQIESSLLTVVADDYVKGASNAPVTLVEYLDFECEACAAYFPLVKELEKDFPKELKIVQRYFPLAGHKNGLPAALAVEAAARQGKYWEMHDLLFLEQKKWGERQMPDPAIFENYAKTLGLDLIQFKKDVVSQSVKDRVQRDMESGDKVGVRGTPSFFLNGKEMPLRRSYADLKTVIQAEVLKTSK